MSQPAYPSSFGSISVRVPPVFSGARIGVMGGTFNPPHAGHVEISRTAMRRLKLDQLWWVVTPGNPLKENGGLPATAERVAACRALIHDPRVVVTSFEEELGAPYTAGTLAFLKTHFPSAHFIWVMGADNLAGFHRWQRWREIATAMPIAIIDRPSWRLKALASPAAQALERARIPENRAGELTRRKAPAWVFLTSRLSPLSSTMLRSGALHNDPRPEKQRSSR